MDQLLLKDVYILTDQKREQQPVWLLAPIAGIAIFAILYVISTLLYPGGSQADKNSTGFSWIHNYWCNLLYNKAINGQGNVAKPIAMTAMFILCITLTCFYFLFAAYAEIKKELKFVIQISGTLSMLIGFLLFTDINHDLIINVASSFGVISTLGILNGLFRSRWQKLFLFGCLNILLVALNNYVYYTKGLIVYLPVVQKISFASYLSWISCIDYQLYKRMIQESKPSH